MNKLLTHLPRLCSYSASFLLLLAIWPMPEGYYTFLRFALVVITLALIIQLHSKKISRHLLILIAIALLFNPIFPFHLSRSLWIAVDVIVAIYFALTAKTLIS
jgi:hypothetical protein